MKKILAILAFFVTVQLCLGRTPTTYYFATTGNNGNPGTIGSPFQTAQYCVNQMVAGDTCLGRTGTYNQSSFLYLGTGHTNVGTDWGSGKMTLGAYNGEVVTFTHNSEKAILELQGGGSGHDHLYWEVRDIVFDGSSGFYPGSGTSGALIEGAGDYVRLRNLRVHHGVNVGIQPEGDYWEVLDCEVDNNGTVVNTDGIQYHGIYSGGSHLTVDGGSYHDNSGSGIQIFSSGHNDVSFNIVRNAIFYHNDQYDPNCGCYEISVGTGEGNLVYNNIIYNFTIGAIQLDFRCGLYGQACAAYQNTIYSASNRTGIRVGSDNLGTILANNIIYIPSGTTISNLGTATVDTHNLKNVNPSFTNSGAADFSLQMGSAAIAYGTDLTSACTGDNIALCSDINGDARGSTPDAGADQYASGTPPSISSISPNIGSQGDLVAIAVTGSSTNFSNGSSVCTVSGSNIIIIGTTASSATAAVCTITIGSNAATGTRDITITTGGEVVTASAAFTVQLLNSRQFQLFRIH